MTKEQVLSILKGAGVAAAGAVLTYLTQWVAGHDLGVWTPIVVAGLGVLVNVVRKVALPAS